MRMQSWLLALVVSSKVRFAEIIWFVLPFHFFTDVTKKTVISSTVNAKMDVVFKEKWVWSKNLCHHSGIIMRIIVGL